MYDRAPAAYHRATSSGLMAWLLAGRRETVGEAVRGRILDIGFGTGLSLPHYPAAGEVVGLDLSLPMLRHARAAGPRPALLIQADAEHLPFPGASFDSVAFNLCLCTIPDPEAAVREGLRVARPGAVLVFLEHVRSHLTPVALLQDILDPPLVLLAADHFNRRTAETVRRAGVEVESVERWGLGIFNLIIGPAPLRT